MVGIDDPDSRGPSPAYEMIRDTVQDRDQLLVIQEDYEIQVRDLITERDQYSTELLIALRSDRAREQSLAVTVVTNEKSTKILDPPILTDGQNPTFTSWLSKMRNKLKVNSDHFVDKEAKIAYV
jgi:hypothetical protein